MNSKIVGRRGGEEKLLVLNNTYHGDTQLTLSLPVNLYVHCG
jgi:adenosylmethionine-8-amino-7-oxononanoate aminotransferase